MGRKETRREGIAVQLEEVPPRPGPIEEGGGRSRSGLKGRLQRQGSKQHRPGISSLWQA